MRRCLSLALAVVLALPGLVPAASATPARSCAAPPLPPEGAPLVVDPATVTSPVGTGVPANRGASRLVQAGVDNFVACIDSGDHLMASTLFTAHFVRDFMGQQSYRGVPLVLGGLTMEHLRIERILAYADGSFSTDGTYLAWGHKIAHERTFWWYDRGDGFLKVNGIQPLEPRVPPGSAELSVEMGEYFYRLSTETVCAPAGTVVLRLKNVGQERHEAVVLRLPEGAVPEDLFNGTLSPEDVQTIGHDNGADVMPLIRMAPGTYTLVDFIPAPDGIPHAIHGQTAQFTVTCQG